MFNVLTLNKISASGLSNFDASLFACADNFENPDAIIVRSASMHEMDLPQNLLAVARAGAGVNNIPIDKCTENGICVFNTPGANANAVKELVICSLFLTSRKIVEGTRWVEGLKGEGSEVSKKVEKGKSQFAGPEVLGKTLGVVGLGAIGTLVANCAKALGMNVVAYVHRNPEEKKSKLVDGIAVSTDLNAVIAQSDYISLHAPLNDSTRGIINAKSLENAKDGVRILNFARAELVDNLYLIKALESGKVSAYATDFPTDEQLCAPGVIAIPHLGASTPESEENCAVMAVKELSEYLVNGNVVNSVNLPNLCLERSGRVRIAAITKADISESLLAALKNGGLNILNCAAAVKKGNGYAVFDTNDEITDDCIEALKAIPGVVAIRII